MDVIGPTLDKFNPKNKVIFLHPLYYKLRGILFDRSRGLVRIKRDNNLQT